MGVCFDLRDYPHLSQVYEIIYVMRQYVSSSKFYVATYFGIHNKYIFLVYELFQCVSSGNIQSETLFGIDSHILV